MSPRRLSWHSAGSRYSAGNRYRGIRRAAAAVVPLALAGACLALGSPARASTTAPDPGSPGARYFPPMSPGTFASPPAAARVKFRWWQPVADTSNAEIAREVATMAGNFGGGFEQNGFPVRANCGGCSSQYLTFASSQEYGQQYGWGSPLWSQRTQAYQQAAARDNVIGDMNEGSRWNNNVPSVYSPNQPAGNQDLSYGVRQYQPGQDPGGELPPVTAPALGGESTSLTVTAKPGDDTIQVQSIAGLLAGDQLTLGQGSAAENATIKSVGTASPSVTLSQPASAGATVVHVPPASGTSGVPGTAQLPAQFVPGEDVTIGSGASAQRDVIASIGTYDMATKPTTLVLPPGGSGTVAAPAGATNVEVASTANFLKGDTITIGTGDTAESRTITAVGGAGRGSTLSAAASAGDLQVKVASSAGLQAGQYITIGQQTDRIATVSGSTLTLYSALQDAHAAGDPLALKSVGVTFTPALAGSHDAGEQAIDTGTGITLKHPLTSAHPAGEEFTAPGTGVTLAAPLAKPHLAGANNAVASTLATASDAGATTVMLGSVANLAAGDQLTIGRPGYSQTVTIASVSSDGVTLAAPLAQSHDAGDPVVDATSAAVTNASGGVSDIEKENLVAAELVQCLPPATADTEVPQTTTLGADAAAGDTTISAGPIPFTGSPVTDWIWNTPGSAASTGAALGTIYLRKTFSTPSGMTRALLRINADDAETTYVNGVQVASSSNWRISETADITKDLNPAGQQNVIAVAATNAGSDPNAAGLIAAVQLNGASPVRIGTDPSWKAWPAASAKPPVSSTPPASDWNTAGFDDSSWQNANSAGAYGVSPWGTQPDGSVTNLSAGDQVTVGAGAGAETRTITALNGSTATLNKALDGTHPAGDPLWDTCTTAPSGGTRQLDPATAIDVTKSVTANALNWTEGSLRYPAGKLPEGNGQPWELIDFYLHGDTQAMTGATATTPNQWLGHLSATSAKAMTDYFDQHILNNPATQAAIRYQDAHTGTPAVFEDSLENASNLEWVPAMVSSWQSDLGYNPTSLLPALAATGRDATSTPAFDFPQGAGQGATLGWRVRDDYGQMWNDLYINDYVKTLDSWASAHGLVARFQPYGDPIDAGEAAANIGLVETEHLELASADETQQFKVVDSGTFQDAGKHLLSDECCEANGQAWADPFGIDGTGDGTSPDATQPNAQSVYADEAGGDSQIIYHGWPYTIGAAGSPALWPGNTYGGDASYAAGNGPNQPQFADDRDNNVSVARHDLVLRQGEPEFDAAVFHEDFGLANQGQDNLTTGWKMGTVISPDGSYTPTSGQLLRSSSSLSQAGYLYGYVSPAFFRYPTATFGPDSGNRPAGKVLFPGHGDYRSLVLYNQSVLPPDVANKLAALAGQGLPIVIVGQVPDAAPNASGGTLAGMRAADARVQAAMAKVTASPHTAVVADATAAGSQSADQNAPGALQSLGIDASTRMNTAPAGGDTATPVLGIARHASNADYYQLFNSSSTTTVRPSVTLAGRGTPYLLDTWTGKATPIANYKTSGDRVTVSLRIGPADAVIVAVTPADLFGAAPPGGGLHATATTADAVYGGSGSLLARASATGNYTTTLSNGKTVTSKITVPDIAPGSTVSMINNLPTLTNWQLSVDSWTQTPSGDPTQTAHTAIPAAGNITVGPLSGVTDGSLPSWTQITPQNIPGLPAGDNLTNVAGIGSYTTSFALPASWSADTAGAYLNIGAAVDTVDIWVNGKAVTVNENDRNQVDIGPYLRAGSNTLKIAVATPLRNAVAVAPATPATGQVANSSETIGALQGGPKIPNMGLLGPVTLTPYGQAALGQ